MRKSHLFWYMLLYINHRNLQREFLSLWRELHHPTGFALWHQKNKAYWITSLPELKPRIMVEFRKWEISHMNIRPPLGETRFVAGDRNALRY